MTREPTDEPGMAGDVSTAFGERLRELRKQAGMAQEGLAKRAGISPGHLHRLEGGKANPSPLTAEVLAEALGEAHLNFDASDRPFGGACYRALLIPTRTLATPLDGWQVFDLWAMDAGTPITDPWDQRLDPPLGPPPGWAQP